VDAGGCSELVRADWGFWITIPGRMTVQQQLESGLSNQRAGRLAEAERIYRQVLVQQPNHVGALHSLGIVAAQAGRLDAAIDLFRRAIAVCTTNAYYHNDLGKTLAAVGRLDEAIASFRQAIGLLPDDADMHINIGNALQRKGNLDEAIASYNRAISVKPEQAHAYNNLGIALARAGMLREAHAAFQYANRLKPDYGEAHANLGKVLSELGNFDGAIDAYCQSLFTIPLLSNHDHEAFEVFCYAHVAKPDAMTDRLRGYADHWQSIVRTPDAEVAQTIREDRIDILIDLAMHMAGNRFAIFARKPAPVQDERCWFFAQKHHAFWRMPVAWQGLGQTRWCDRIETSNAVCGGRGPRITRDFRLFRRLVFVNFVAEVESSHFSDEGAYGVSCREEICLAASTLSMRQWAGCCPRGGGSGGSTRGDCPERAC
jgi:tetratricopeptide (TPR) repeat protein